MFYITACRRQYIENFLCYWTSFVTANTEVFGKLKSASVIVKISDSTLT